MSALELVLTHEQDRWRARGEGIDVAHATLAGLDALIAAALAVEAGPRRVHVRFDFGTLPTWLRQYHAHYLSYSLEVGASRAS